MLTSHYSFLTSLFMARTHTTFSVELLARVGAQPSCSLKQLFEQFDGKKRKVVYDTIFRLLQQDLLAYADPAKSLLQVTGSGRALLSMKRPEREEVWKLVIFDIPERQRRVRTLLRNRLKTLGFKKWQASIWVSPYKLDQSLEDELYELAKRLFVRVIKTTDINYTKDLEELFTE